MADNCKSQTIVAFAEWRIRRNQAMTETQRGNTRITLEGCTVSTYQSGFLVCADEQPDIDAAEMYYNTLAKLLTKEVTR